MKKIRIVTFGLAVCAAALAFAIPAMAHQSATSITVTAGKPSEFHFTLSKASTPAGAVTFKVTNKGALPHDFSIDGKKTKLLSPGASATLSVTLKKGSNAYECTVTGHAAAGMK